MNPSGFVVRPDSHERVYFSAFRPYLVRAGFEVVDCPPLTRGGKNAADIRIVLDVMDAMAHPTHYREFVIASGDSDFTPLLHRLRAHNRRTTIVASTRLSPAYTALADIVIEAHDLLAVLEDQGPTPPDRAGEDAVHEEAALPPVARYVPEQFKAAVEAAYRDSDRPINLAQLTNELQERLGRVETAGWFGHRTFSSVIASLQLPGAMLSGHSLWDSRRHDAPAHVGPGQPLIGAPEPVGRLTATTDLPKLDRDAWRAVFAGLAEYAATHEFNLTESTRWVRDQLSAQGLSVGRGAVVFALQGANLGGAPLQTQPTADALAAAFLRSLRYRARVAGVVLTDEDAVTVAEWIGAPPPAATSPDSA